MDGWEIFWKGTFLVGLGLFSLMAVWVAVAGARDVKRLFSRLKEGSDREPPSAPR